MFDLGQLLGPLISSPYRFRDLWNLLEDQEALSVHYGKWRSISTDENGTLERPLSDEIKNTLQLEVKDARRHYANMMLVTSYTCLEDIIYSFFKAFFQKQPLAINEHLRNDGREAVIPLRTFLAQSKEEILSQMIGEASKIASSGEITSVFKRIKKHSGYQIPKDLEAKVSNLRDVRNRIVHEALQLNIGSEEVIDAFDTVQSVLRHLGLAATQAGVFVSDPAHLLDQS
ncbi:HEPN domain-containing protein [Metapseudomonas otitidis]|uniref:HEPN domain-containing protein n=1 Tax=Metapseudomonas otitidis TaxID=319939 RepID=UPI003CED0359